MPLFCRIGFISVAQPIGRAKERLTDAIFGVYESLLALSGSEHH